MKQFILILFVFAIVSAYSYTDKCYRFKGERSDNFMFYYQYYINKDGIPLCADYIVHQSAMKDVENVMYSFYYHYVYSDCKKEEDHFSCTNTCESIWFKFHNMTAAGENMVQNCDPIFREKYANINIYGCNMTMDPFQFIRPQIGTVKKATVYMDGNVPRTPQNFSVDESKCIWEYEILGLVPIITVVIVGSICIVALIIFIILVVFTQKHRSEKRKKLASALIQSNDKSQMQV